MAVFLEAAAIVAGKAWKSQEIGSLSYTLALGKTTPV
jgi:hypothetical protein